MPPSTQRSQRRREGEAPPSTSAAASSARSHAPPARTRRASRPPARRPRAGRRSGGQLAELGTTAGSSSGHRRGRPGRCERDVRSLPSGSLTAARIPRRVPRDRRQLHSRTIAERMVAERADHGRRDDHRRPSTPPTWSTCGSNSRRWPERATAAPIGLHRHHRQADGAGAREASDPQCPLERRQDRQVSRAINIGIAVDTEAGLLVPVIRDVPRPDAAPACRPIARPDRSCPQRSALGRRDAREARSPSPTWDRWESRCSRR